MLHQIPPDDEEFTLPRGNRGAFAGLWSGGPNSSSISTPWNHVGLDQPDPNPNPHYSNAYLAGSTVNPYALPGLTLPPVIPTEETTTPDVNKELIAMTSRVSAAEAELKALKASFERMELEKSNAAAATATVNAGTNAPEATGANATGSQQVQAAIANGLGDDDDDLLSFSPTSQQRALANPDATDEYLNHLNHLNKLYRIQKLRKKLAKPDRVKDKKTIMTAPRDLPTTAKANGLHPATNGLAPHVIGRPREAVVHDCTDAQDWDMERFFSTGNSDFVIDKLKRKMHHVPGRSVHEWSAFVNNRHRTCAQLEEIMLHIDLMAVFKLKPAHEETMEVDRHLTRTFHKLQISVFNYPGVIGGYFEELLELPRLFRSIERFMSRRATLIPRELVLETRNVINTLKRKLTTIASQTTRIPSYF